MPGLAAALMFAGCGFSERAHPWADQLQADGPCWRVQLADGLDETSVSELQDLFACLNRQGALQPLAATVTALEQPTRAGEPAGLELARLVNRLPELDLDLGRLVQGALDLLDDPDEPIRFWGRLWAELVLGRPWLQIGAPEEYTQAAALEDGLAAPTLALIPPLASSVLDEELDALSLLAEVLDDPAVQDLSCSITGLGLSEEHDLVALRGALLADLGDALQRTRDTSNDRWTGASGSSLRDLLQALLLPGSAEESVLMAARPSLLAIIEDPLVQARLRQTLRERRESGELALVLPQLRRLATVDRDGGSLESGEDSALIALIRLLDQANTEVSCSVNLVVTTLRIDLGNLSVALLSLLADQQAEAGADGVDLLGDLLGLGLSQSTLDLIADSGLCPAIDDQLVADLQAIDRLGDAEARALLVFLLDLLDDLRNGEEDRLPDLVDMLSLIQDRQAVHPLEELLLDLGASRLAADLVGLLDLLIDDQGLARDACAEGSQPLDLEGLLGLLRAALAERLEGAPLRRLQPQIDLLLASPATWTLLDNLGALARQPDALLHELWPRATAKLAETPGGDELRALAEGLRDERWTRPVLQMVEVEGLLSALGEAGEPEAPGPLPWSVRLILGGTLDTLLRTLDLALDALAPTAEATARAPSPSP